MAKSEELLRQVINKLLKEKGHKEFDVEIKEISTGGANYTSILFSLSVNIPYNDELKLFAKVSNLNAELRSNPVYSEVFSKENFFYTDLILKFKELEEKHGVPKEDRFIAAEYFGSTMKEFEEVLILEDLTAKGFTLQDRFKPVTWEYAAKAMESLAKLHALSIAYKQENPDALKDLRHLSFNMDVEVNEKLQETFLNPMLESVYSVTTEDKKYRLQKYFEGGNRMEDWLKTSTMGACQVLIHGDYRPSNMMHRRYNGQIEVVPVDYQTIYCGRPINDIMYFIYTGTDAQFRKYHYNNLLQHYYTQLTLALNRLKIDVATLYSKEDFENDLKVGEMIGLFVGVTVLSVVTVEVEHAPKMDAASNFTDFVAKPSDLYQLRINEIIDEYISKGLI